MNKKLLSLLILLALPMVAKADIYFNPDLVTGNNTGSSKVDLSVFEDGANSQAPGNYIVSIMMNKDTLGKFDISFYKDKKKGGILAPCITKKLAENMGIADDIISRFKDVADDQCVDIFSVIQGSNYNFDFNNLELDIDVPSSALNSDKNYVNKNMWDEGINAAILNYEYSASINDYRGRQEKSQILNLDMGLNLGPWRIRDNAIWSDDREQQKWNNISLYANRDIKSLNSTLTVGQTYSQSDIFDSINIIGFLLSSNEQMYPDNEQGFSPTITGTANSNARVSVYQDNQLLYEKFVPPGQFSITNLPSIGSNGDLRVVVTEADGSQHSYIVPYASIPVLVRPGRFKYQASVGRINDTYSSNKDNKDIISQASLYYGLPWNTTIYGGAELFRYYKAAAIGAGLNLGDFGAFSFDVTEANSKLERYGITKDYEGQAYRFLYAKGIQSTGTNFQIIGYKYNTKNYYSLEEVLANNDIYSNNNNHYIPQELYRHEKSRVTGVITQSFNDWGSISGSLSLINYWDKVGNEKQYSIGYGTNIKGITYDLSYSYSQGIGKPYQSVYFTMSIPFTIGSHYDYVNYGLTHTNDRNYQTVSVSGSALEDNKLSYSVNGIYDGNNDKGGGFNLDYSGDSLEQDFGFNETSGNWQANYQARGGILVHRHGIVFGHEILGTTALIHADGAKDTKISNTGGMRLNSQGYGLDSNLISYRRNDIELNPDILNSWAELENTKVVVIPTDGAIVNAEFKTRVGYKAIFIITGKPIPFGSFVYLGDKSVGIVDDQNTAYLTGLDKSGNLSIKWNSNTDNADQCIIPYSIDKQEFIKDTGIMKIQVVCK